MERKIYFVFRSILLILISSFVLFSLGMVIFSKVQFSPVEKNREDTFLQSSEDVVTEEEEDSTIDIKTPRSNEVVKNPILISGEARGWYFEGVFPVKLVDDNGREIGRGQMQAKGDWMQDKFVSFEGKIEFSKPTTKGGKIIFQKDNPSGLSENDESVELFILFSK